MTGPEWDQVGTTYTSSQNGKYIEFCVEYLLSVSCNMFPIKLSIDEETKLKNVMKFSTWFIFAGPVTILKLY